MLDRLKEISEYIGENHNVKIKEMNGEPDHVHFLHRTKPNCDLSKYINAIKSASERINELAELIDSVEIVAKKKKP